MKNTLILFLAISTIFLGCIKDDFIDDFVEPTLIITTIPDSVLLNSSYQFEYKFLNNIGVEENVDAIWSSANPDVLEIDHTGLALAKTLGSTEITVSYSNAEINVVHTILVNVGLSTIEDMIVKSGSIQSTSSYKLEGDFTVIEEGNNIVIEFSDNYSASTALPGLYVYLSNNPNTITNALEISAVETFEGKHSYTIDDIDINDFKFLVYFCKPFNVKVGDGTIN